MLAGAVATALVALDRVAVSASLAPVFAAMSAVEQGIAMGLLVAGLTALMAGLDVGALVLGRLAGRKAPPIGTGAVAGAYVLLSSVEPVIDGITGFGILGSEAFGRALWGVLVVGASAMGALMAARFRDHGISHASARTRRALSAVGVLPVAVWLVLVGTAPENPAFPIDAASGRPNVLVVVFDGVSADRTTVYGYGRDTTPNLARLAEGALIADNALPDSCTTYGSVAAILGGIPALDLHMVYYPDRLLGRDAFEHLPGLLADGGYRVGVIGARYYVDAAGMGQRGDFAMINRFGGPLELPGLGRDSRPLTTGLRLWLQDLVSRVRRPAAHIVGVRKMATFDQIFNRSEDGDSDAWRVGRFEEHVETSDGGTWFAYVHLMGTHGPHFHPRERVFSSSGATGAWDRDAGDDALRDADAHLGEMLAFLERRGELSHTIVAVLSDHAEEWTCGRVPLVIRLPDRTRTTRISGTVNLTDLAPTLAAAVGIGPPAFMQGTNLLSEAPAAGKVTIHPWGVDTTGFVPPGENLLSVAFRRCDQAWIVPVRGQPVEVVTIAGYVGTECARLAPLDPNDVQRQVFEHLEATGWR